MKCDRDIDASTMYLLCFFHTYNNFFKEIKFDLKMTNIVGFIHVLNFSICDPPPVEFLPKRATAVMQMKLSRKTNEFYETDLKIINIWEFFSCSDIYLPVTSSPRPNPDPPKWNFTLKQPLQLWR